MKTTPSQRIAAMRKQIAYNLVRLAVRALEAKRSPYDHALWLAQGYEIALMTQRQTLHWISPQDRAAVIVEAKECMRQERVSQKAVRTYRTLPYNTNLTVNGRQALWCHVASEYAATVDVQDVAQQLKDGGAATIRIGDRAIEIRVEAAKAVAA